MFNIDQHGDNVSEDICSYSAGRICLNYRLVFEFLA
ncbi:hypothetical protein GGR09_001416 [Bartonella heixiaziensis]